MLKAALMTPRRAPLGLLKSVAIRVSQEYHAMVKRKGQLTGQPRRDSLQTIENGAIVAAGHLATESSRHEGEVKTTEVGLLVPRCGVELHQPVHLRLAGHFVDVCHDHVDCCVFVFWCVIGGCYLAPAIVPNPGPMGSYTDQQCQSQCSQACQTRHGGKDVNRHFYGSTSTQTMGLGCGFWGMGVRRIADARL